MNTNKLINRYCERINTLELSNNSIEILISCIKLAIKELEGSKETNLKKVKLGELITLLNYLESF